ncbi:Hypothetical predicted protein [Mytilus galloprovincialis]|uniref:Uncharacterized protein n=1 Tax=Mytilus galloprovincialis TaxID=29158 RepID=A0A8B6E066_MYTGA|nr:Hypothetical predicted protein [Mytilus galloprovincialis]
MGDYVRYNKRDEVEDVDPLKITGKQKRILKHRAKMADRKSEIDAMKPAKPEPPTVVFDRSDLVNLDNGELIHKYGSCKEQQTFLDCLTKIQKSDSPVTKHTVAKRIVRLTNSIRDHVKKECNIIEQQQRRMARAGITEFER